MQVCTRCVLFENGRLIEDGLPQTIVESYISRNSPVITERAFTEDNAPTSPQRAFRIWSFHVRSVRGHALHRYDVKEPVIFDLVWDVLDARYPLEIQLTLRHESGVSLLASIDNQDSPWRNRIAPAGRYRTQCVIPANFLNEGLFMVDFSIHATNRSSEYAGCADAGMFYVVDDQKNAGVRGDFEGKWPTAIIRPRLQWTHSALPVDLANAAK
jgi:lipopolysaccharide transport system ATP-binding protein